MSFFQSTFSGIVVNLSSLSGKKIVIEGDSITVGVGVSSTQRWTYLFCQSLGATEINQGVSSKSLQNAANCGYPIFNPATAIPVKDNTYGLFILALGVNDILFNNGNFTPVGYKAAVISALQAAKAKGWSSNELLVLSPYFITDVAYIGGNCGSANWDSTRFNAYVQAGQEATADEHCMFVNITSAYLSGDLQDGVHPNISGNSKLSTFLLAQTYRTQ